MNLEELVGSVLHEFQHNLQNYKIEVLEGPFERAGYKPEAKFYKILFNGDEKEVSYLKANDSIISPSGPRELKLWWFSNSKHIERDIKKAIETYELKKKLSSGAMDTFGGLMEGQSMIAMADEALKRLQAGKLKDINVLLDIIKHMSDPLERKDALNKLKNLSFMNYRYVIKRLQEAQAEGN